MGEVETAEGQPIFERDEFVKNKLGSIEVKDNTGNKTSLKASLGDRYPLYEELVLERIRRTDTLPTKRVPRKEFEQGFMEKAKEAGFSGASLNGIRRRSDHLYRVWLGHKLVSQAREEVFRVKGGEDPNTFLGDGSHRRGLGYIQSQRDTN